MVIKMIFEIINVKFNNCLCIYINKNEFEKLIETKHLDEFIQKSKNLYVGLPKTSDKPIKTLFILLLSHISKYNLALKLSFSM